MVPEIVDLAPQPAVVVRLNVPIGSVHSNVVRLLPDLHKLVLEVGGRPAGPHFTRFIRFTGNGQMEVETGLPLLEPVNLEPQAESVTLPGGMTATVAHLGPHKTLPNSHAALDEWLEVGGRLPGGPRWEAYITDSRTETDPSRWQTRLFQPLA